MRSQLDFLLPLLNKQQIKSVQSRNTTIIDQDILISLDISSLGMCDIPEDFTFPPTLQILNISHNLIRELPPDFLSGMDQLVNLNLRKNMLTSLPEGIFDGCENLTYLDISLNQIQVLHETIFAGTKHLRQLILDANQLRKLPEDIFQPVSGLQVLSLASNLLASLPSSLSPSILPQLKQLNLINNRGLKSLGKKYTSSLIIKKMLKSL